MINFMKHFHLRAWRLVCLPTSIIFLGALNLHGSAIAHPVGDQPINIELDTWKATIAPKNLQVWGEKKSGGQRIMIAQSSSFQRGRINVDVAGDGDFLHFSFSLKDKINEEELKWPEPHQDLPWDSLIIPSGEGLQIPIKDPLGKYIAEKKKTWGFLGADGGGGLSLPLWGYRFKDETVTFIVQDPFDSELELIWAQGKLQTAFSHKMQAGKKFEFDIVWKSPNRSPIDAGLVYRSYLEKKNNIVSLKEKSKKKPDVEKLAGAIHAYLWGDGRTEKFLDMLAASNVTKAQLSFDQTVPLAGAIPKKDPWVKKQYYVDKSIVDKAKRLGYLVGPYDSWHTMENPKKADSANLDFGDFFPEGCIRDVKQKIPPGFANKGCYVSSLALEQSTKAKKRVADRVQSFADMGINAYFIDCDATGELFDDFTTGRRMSAEQDQQLRLARMGKLDDRFVLGSETVSFWATPVVDFSHGGLAVFNAEHFPLTSNHKVYGGWWPPERPSFFFKETSAPREYVKTKYSPAYRIPLFEVVYHHSVVSTDRWEIPITKFPDLVETRLFIELLYGSPSMWSFDIESLNKNMKLIRAYYPFFFKLHSEVWDLKLEDFRWLDTEGLVQQTRFENGNTLVANFSNSAFNKYQARSLTWERSGSSLTLTERSIKGL